MPHPPSTERHPLFAPYLAAQLAGDRGAALRLVVDQGLDAGVSVPVLQLDILQPAQREIGRLWQENRISVAQEHVATSISQLVLSHLYTRLPREQANGRRAMVACVEGERHDMGARMGADFLEMAGFDVRFLGADVPTRSLLEMIEVEQPDVLGLSVALSFNVPSLERTVAAVRSAYGTGLPILVGGHVAAWLPELRDKLEVQAVGMDAGKLVVGARELLAC